MAIDIRFSNTFYRVEASQSEQAQLYDTWSDKYTWEDESKGFAMLMAPAYAGGFAMCEWSVIHDRRVMFWTTSGTQATRDEAELWLSTHCHCPATDALNFGKCIREIERLSKQ